MAEQKQTEQPADVEGMPSPPIMSLPQQIAPLVVVKDFVAAVNSGSIRRELADDCVLSFLGRYSRGGTVAAGYLRVLISAHYQHEGFEEAAVVTPEKTEQLKTRFMRCFTWVRRRMVEQKVRERAESLHLRAESDDDEEQPPSRCPAELVTPPRAGIDMNQMKFVESNGVLKSLRAGGSFMEGGLDLGNSRTVDLTLGYRQVPLAFGNGCAFEICLIVYEKSCMAPRRGSAAPCNALTDDEEDDYQSGPGVRRSLYAEFCNEQEDEDDEEEDEEEVEVPQEQEQQPALEHIQVPNEEGTLVLAQPAASEEPPAPSASSSSYTPRKRHATTNEDEVQPKRKPGRNRMRF